MIPTPCMDSIMMKPTERYTVIWVESLARISVPRDDVMCFYAFCASAQPANKPVTFADLVSPGSTTVLYDPVLVDILFVWYRSIGPAVIAFTAVLLASVAADYI